MDWFSIAPKHGPCMAKLVDGDPCPMPATVTNERGGEPDYFQVCDGHFTCDVDKWLPQGDPTP